MLCDRYSGFPPLHRKPTKCFKGGVSFAPCLRQISRSSRVFRPPKHTYLEWNLLHELYGNVGFIAIRDFSFEEKSICAEWRLARDGWSGLPFHSFSSLRIQPPFIRVSHAVAGANERRLYSQAILLEGRVMVSNNFTKRRQNGFKIGTRDKFTIH